MPQLNIDVKARTAQARKELKDIDKEVLKISKSEEILAKAVASTGETSKKQFRSMNSAAIKQAKAVNSAALQYKQLRAQLEKSGAAPQVIGKVTTEFIRFRKEMERGIVGSNRFQKSQDRLRSVMGTTRRALARQTAELKKNQSVVEKGGRSVTGLGKTLENLGSTAVLVLGPLSGIGSRLIAFGAIAKRGNIRLALMFSTFAGLFTLLGSGIKVFGTLHSYIFRVNAILKATGKSAEITAEGVNNIAEAVARTTLAGLSDTRKAAAGLLVFTGIGADNLQKMLHLAQDMASLGIVDLSRAFRLLGRAMEDPIENLDSFRRLGIQFDPVQKMQITRLQNLGRVMEAQGIIIDEIAGKVGGSGIAANTGLSGAMDELGQAWQEFQEAIGNSVFYDLAVTGIHKLVSAFNFLRDTVELFIPPGIDLPKVTLPVPGVGETVHQDGTTTAKTEAPRASRLDAALLKQKSSLEASIVEYQEQLQKSVLGYRTISSEALKLADSHGVLSDSLKAIRGDLSAFEGAGDKTIREWLKLNDAINSFKEGQEGFSLKLSLETNAEKFAKGLTLVRSQFDRGIISLETYNRQLVKLKENYTDMLKFESEAEAIFDNTRTGVEKLKAEIAKLNFLFERGYISINTYKRALEQLRTPEMELLDKAFDKFSNNLVKTLTSTDDFAASMKATFKSLVDDILTNFARLAFINPALNAIFGGDRDELGGSGGGMFGLEGLLGDGIAAFFGSASGSMGPGVRGLGSGPGFQHGGSFKVGGTGGADSQAVNFQATPGEKVTVETPSQQKKGEGNVTYIDARGADPAQIDNLKRLIKQLDASIEIRAVTATSDTRLRNPSLFGAGA